MLKAREASHWKALGRPVSWSGIMLCNPLWSFYLWGIMIKTPRNQPFNGFSPGFSFFNMTASHWLRGFSPRRLRWGTGRAKLNSKLKLEASKQAPVHYDSYTWSTRCDRLRLTVGSKPLERIANGKVHFQHILRKDMKHVMQLLRFPSFTMHFSPSADFHFLASQRWRHDRTSLEASGCTPCGSPGSHCRPQSQNGLSMACFGIWNGILIPSDSILYITRDIDPEMELSWNRDNRASRLPSSYVIIHFWLACSILNHLFWGPMTIWKPPAHCILISARPGTVNYSVFFSVDLAQWSQQK